MRMLKALCAALAAMSAILSFGVSAATGAIEIRVLSNRADLISGGDALVEAVLPAGVRPPMVTMHLGTQDVTGQFARRANGRYMAVLKGLRSGRNVLVAHVAGRPDVRTVIVNHRGGGPLFAGPQANPWRCPQGSTNDHCAQPRSFAYYYISTDSQKDGFQPYDPANPATDVASTTTDNGTTVPFIVRVETGYQDRDQYRIATLFQPGTPWTPYKPQPQFNHKLVITHGASCDVDYSSGGAPSVLSFNPADLVGAPSIPGSPLADSVRYALGAGFIIMSTALDNNGHDCDVVIQAESLVMAKEHLIEEYGELRYTIGTGCSGGSLAQQWIANAYPGIYQGILPTCSFPDTWSSATQVMDYHLLRAYFEAPSRWGDGIAWTPDQWADIEGNQLPVDAIVSDIGFFAAIIPTHDCGGIGDAQRYDPATNPTGVRCSIAELGINVFGRRDPSVWTPNEVALGHGFAGVPVDNVGVQYGLAALQAAQITPAQFIDLNAKVGGLDIDINPTAARIAADRPALAYAYRSGMINVGNNLDRVAIIDCRGPDPGAAHDSYRAFAIRARLDRELGTHGNQSIWEGPAAIVGDSQCSQTSLIAMDRWLAAVEADSSATTLAHKIIADRPGDAGDQCWDGGGHKVGPGLCPPGVVPVYGTPRTVAGDAITTDTNKCQLVPLDRTANYGPVPFTDAQWAQLQAIFPAGVCNFALPAVDFTATVPWLTYGSATTVVYGGTPLPPAPAHSGDGWAAPSFAAFRH